jgi:hypothetical protein
MAKARNNYKSVAMRGACILGGLIAGTYVKNLIAKKDATNGTDLLGLSGDTSAVAAPAIITAAGFAANAAAKNQMLKDVALGMVAAGGAGLLNAVTGKSVVSLSGAEDQPIEVLPGLGIDEEKVMYDELPTDNELLTSYHENVGDTEEEKYEYVEEEEPVGDVDDLEEVEVNGTDVVLL